MWELIDVFYTVFQREEYGLYKRRDDGVTVYRCAKSLPPAKETGGYFKASAALNAKGL